MVKIPDQKVLLLDIETKPAIGYTWRAYDTNINVDQIIDPGGVICVGVKWLGDKTVEVFSDWAHGHMEMLVAIHDRISHADAVVTFNGDRFDLPKLEGEFVLHGFEPAPPCTSIDCYKAVKKLGLFMNKLAFVGPFLGLGKKLEHEGFNLWKKVMDGDPKAQDRMAKYCGQDVTLLEKLYLKLRPYIRNHPHMGKVAAQECGACGSKHVHSRGTRRTRAYKIQRLQCQDCGAWQDGVRKKI